MTDNPGLTEDEYLAVVERIQKAMMIEPFHPDVTDVVLLIGEWQVWRRENERLRAEVEQVELINFRRVEENTQLRKALTMIRNAVDITRDQVTEGWIIGVADDALKLG